VSVRIRAGSRFKRFLCIVFIDVKSFRVPTAVRVSRFEDHCPKTLCYALWFINLLAGYPCSFFPPFCLHSSYTLILIIQVAGPSETSCNMYEGTLRHVLEDNSIHSQQQWELQVSYEFSFICHTLYRPSSYTWPRYRALGEMRSMASSGEMNVADVAGWISSVAKSIPYSKVWQSLDLTTLTAQSVGNGQVKQYGRYIIS
jgi:hypothetical protein